MPKVVTGKDFDNFVLDGTHQTIDGGSKRVKTPLPEAVKPAVIDLQPAGDPKPDAPDEDAPAADTEGIDDKSRKAVNKKHREMKQAEALATKLRKELEDTEGGFKSQYLRAQAAEEEAQKLRTELDSLRAKVPTVDKSNVKPDPKDFTDEQGQFKAFEYAEKLSEYSALKAVADDRANQVKEQRDREAKEAEDAAKARVEVSKTLHKDWQQAVDEAGVNVHPQVAQYMTVSEHIGEIAYYLAKHPDFAERINKLHPLKAIAEIGKLEASWDKKDEPKADPVIPKASGGAPAPISILNGSGSPGVNTDPAKMSPKELLAYTRERAVAKRKR